MNQSWSRSKHPDAVSTESDNFGFTKPRTIISRRCQITIGCIDCLGAQRKEMAKNKLKSTVQCRCSIMVLSMNWKSLNICCRFDRITTKNPLSPSWHWIKPLAWKSTVLPPLSGWCFRTCFRKACKSERAIVAGNNPPGDICDAWTKDRTSIPTNLKVEKCWKYLVPT